MRDLDFQHSNAVYLAVLCLVIFLLQFFLYRYRRTQNLKYASTNLLPHLLVPRSKLYTFLKMGLWCLVWIFASLALMSPEGNTRYLPTSSSTSFKKSNQTHELIFLVDTSASMGVPDGKNGQTRLDQSKEIMDNIMSRVSGVSVALYPFTSELTSDVPPTLDYLFVRLMIKELQLNEGNVGGTRFEPVLQDLKNRLSSDPLAHTFTVFLFSDGGDNFVYDQGSTSSNAINQILAVLPDPHSLHLKIYTIGVGKLTASSIPNVTSQGIAVQSKLEPELLQKIAEKENGDYFDAGQWTNWDLAVQLSNIIIQANTNQKEIALSRTVVPVKADEKITDLYYQIPLGVSIILLILGLALPETRKIS